MVVKWTKKASSDLSNFYHTSLFEQQHLTQYINNLVSFANNLSSFPNMGKVILEIKRENKQLEIRQLIYEQHRIIYYNIDNQIYIISIIHMKQDLKKILKDLK